MATNQNQQKKVSARSAGKETPNKPTVPREAMKNNSTPKTEASQTPYLPQRRIENLFHHYKENKHFMEMALFMDDIKWYKKLKKEQEIIIRQSTRALNYGMAYKFKQTKT